MDSFVEGSEQFKAHERCAVRHSVAKQRSSLLVHTCGHEVTGLKTYRGAKRKEQLGVLSKVVMQKASYGRRRRSRGAFAGLTESAAFSCLAATPLALGKRLTGGRF
jgi:hypothetical protein